MSSILLIGFISCFINAIYFFNPISYKKDDITYLPWTWYKNPMSISYDTLIKSSNTGWKIKQINDKNEIILVFNELKKCEPIPDYKPINQSKLNELVIRSSNNGVVLFANIFDDGKVALVKSSNKYIRLTNKLTELVTKRIAEAK